MPDHIIKQDVLSGYIEEMARYAIADNRRRMVPDIRDGLKPVQRRNIYTLAEDGAMSEGTKKKCARIVGDCMGKYHPHGDCQFRDTLTYLLDGSTPTIEELYQRGEPVQVLSVDPTTGKTVPAIAHSFRIGQYTDKIYHIVLSNGHEIKCTNNHPFMLPDGSWIKAEDINPYTRLYSNPIFFNGRPRVGGQGLVQNIVYDYFNSPLPEGWIRHHINGNYNDNRFENLTGLSRVDHAKMHGDYNAGLDAGRESMFGDSNPEIREAIKHKNSVLMGQFNKEQGIRRFKLAVSKLEERGLPITEENYESLRGEIYNLPMVSRLIKRHPEYGTSFEELVNLDLPTIGDKYDEYVQANPIENNAKPEAQLQQAISFPNEYINGRYQTLYVLIDRMIDEGYPYNALGYLDASNSASYKHQLAVDVMHINTALNLYQYEKPFVTNVWIEDVDHEPMYDFTVDGFENMLIPVGATAGTPLEMQVGKVMPMVCAHNSSIYGALKPISNWWECKLPLAHIHGNSGNFQGDGMAAMRYTEAYLTEFSVEFMQMLRKYSSATDWSPNFDNSTTEPDYLPFLIPVLLINGASGIGVGMRMDLPPHNPREVIRATRSLLKNPNADVVLVPDFCMPCDIIDNNWKQISNTGVGKFKARGHAHTGEYKKHPAIFITSLPQGVNSGSITSKLNDMMQKGTINSIQNIYWEGNENDVNLVVQLKKGQSPEYMLDMIYKYTQLESSYSINFEAIYGVEHLRFSYKSYLQLFIETAKLTIFRMYQEKYQQVMTRWHQLDAYIKVIQSGEIDNIYKAIRKSKSEDLDQLVQWLCKKLDITDLQAGYIIKTDLGKFSKGYLEKYLAESQQCWNDALEYQKIILDDDRITQELDQTLEYYDKKYCKPRICNIISESDTSNIPKGKFVLVITENNYVRKLPEGSTINTVRKDYPNYIIEVENTENILLFANTGKVYKLPIYKIPVTDKSGAGTDIRTLVKGLTSDICSVMYEPSILAASKLKRKHYMVVLSAGNTIKKLDLEDFLTVPPSGIIYTKLNDNDMVVSVGIVPDGMDVVVYSGHKALRMKMKDIPHYKRSTLGVLAMNTKDPIEGMDTMYDDITHIVVVTRSGKINRFIAEGLITGKRYQTGSSVIKLGARDNVVSIYGVNEKNSIRVVTSSNTIDIPVADIPCGSSVSSGTKIPGVSAQDIVVKTKLIK